MKNRKEEIKERIKNKKNELYDLEIYFRQRFSAYLLI